MGQKCNPIGFRVGITEGWKSRWYAPKAAFGSFLVEDEKIRKFIDDHLNRQKPFKDDRDKSPAYAGVVQGRDRADARRGQGRPARGPAGDGPSGPKGPRSTSSRSGWRT